MLSRIVLAGILAVAPCGAQARTILSCEGRKPPWDIYLEGDTVIWNYRKSVSSLRGFQALEPDDQRRGNRVWVYQPESPTIGLKIIVQENGGGGCPYFDVNSQASKDFTAIVITASEVLVGCCRKDEKSGRNILKNLRAF